MSGPRLSSPGSAGPTGERAKRASLPRRGVSSIVEFLRWMGGWAARGGDPCAGALELDCCKDRPLPVCFVILLPAK